MVVLFAEPGYLFHNLLLLVDFDGIDATKFTLVFEFTHLCPEGFVHGADLGIQNIFDAQEDRHLISPIPDSGDDLGQIDGHVFLIWKRCNNHVAFG